MGRAVSQLEEPFSCFSIREYCKEDSRDDFNWLAVSVSERCLFLEISFLASSCFSHLSILSSIKVFRGPATFIDAENSSGARVTGFFRLKPPRRGGRANISLSESVVAGFPPSQSRDEFHSK